MAPTQSPPSQPSPTRVNLQLTGTPQSVGQHTLQPVAQLTGWKIGMQELNATAGAAWLRLTPVAVEVTQTGVAPYTLPLSNPAHRELWALIVAALAIAAFCGTINLLVRRWLS